MSDDDGTNQDDIDDIMNDGPDDAAAAAAAGGPPADDGMTVADALNLDEMTGELLNDEQKREFEMGEPMAGDVSAIYDIPVQISAVLGRSTMQVSQLL
jgi:flagellar motor switch/type III secretory pathway protein FliN